MDVHEEGRWRDRRFLAFGLRTLVIVLPLLVAVLTVQVANVVFMPRTWSLLQELLLMTPLALVSVLVTERALRRFLPLAMLLRMDMAFPGRAPSRYAVARQARSRDQLMAMLADRDAGPQQAAHAMMTLLAALAGHDRKTRGHSERTRVLADVLGTELKLSPYDRDRLRWAALLHDIGKLEIAPKILNKPSALNDSEWRRMRLHPVHGAELTSALTGWLGPWAEGILHHHEKFDGSGYPGGIAGEEISLAGRVISVVDAYESMTAARPYQKARATRDARRELVRCAGTHFDPAVVRAFLAISMPRLLWATGALALVTHLPYLRQLQLIGQQASSIAGSQVATAAGVTAMVVSASAVPAWSLQDQPPAPLVHQQVSLDVAAGSPLEPASSDDAPAPVGSTSSSVDSVAAGTGGTSAAASTAAGTPVERQPSGPGTAADRDPAPETSTPQASPAPQDPEQAGRDGTGTDEDGKDKAAKDEDAKDKDAKDKDAKDKDAKDEDAKDKAAKDKAAKDKAAKDKAAKDKAAKDKAAKDKAAKDKAAKDKAAKDKAAKDKAAKDKAAKDKAAKDKGGRGEGGRGGGSKNAAGEDGGQD